MKNLMISLVLVISSFATAQTEVATLKSTMQAMSTSLKAIAAQSTDKTKNASSEKLTLDLIKSVTVAQTLLPSSATDKARKDLYAKMIGQVLTSSKQLAQAFHSNDNTKAAAILVTLTQEKKDGHSSFRQ